MRPDGYRFGSPGPARAVAMRWSVGYSDEDEQKRRPAYRKMVPSPHSARCWPGGRGFVR